MPEVTAVGGTEFNEGNGSYWNDATPALALSYIPEIVWNDSDPPGLLVASGGGPSILFTKPAWQTGPGVPSDNARDIPDVALAASAQHDGFPVYENGTMRTSGGTSVATPSFDRNSESVFDHKGISIEARLRQYQPDIVRSRAGNGAGIL
jgi:subtilase family serine protease